MKVAKSITLKNQKSFVEFIAKALKLGMTKTAVNSLPDMSMPVVLAQHKTTSEFFGNTLKAIDEHLRLWHSTMELEVHWKDMSTALTALRSTIVQDRFVMEGYFAYLYVDPKNYTGDRAKPEHHSILAKVIVEHRVSFESVPSMFVTKKVCDDLAAFIQKLKETTTTSINGTIDNERNLFKKASLTAQGYWQASPNDATRVLPTICKSSDGAPQDLNDAQALASDYLDAHDPDLRDKIRPISKFFRLDSQTLKFENALALDKDNKALQLEGVSVKVELAVERMRVAAASFLLESSIMSGSAGGGVGSFMRIETMANVGDVEVFAPQKKTFRGH